MRSTRSPRGLARRAAAVAARHPRRTIALWLLLVAGCLAAGSLTGTRTLTPAQSGTGESQRADRRVAAAGLAQAATESILVRAERAATSAAAARDLARRLDRVPVVAGVGEQVRGRAVLVQARLRGDPETASDRVAPVQRAVASVARAHPSATLWEAGAASFDRAVGDVVAHDLRRAELVSIPVTLAILVLAFGALVAAVVPLLLGLTSVAAALGALGLVSQLQATSDTTATVIVLIGLAVGVDYSLFYIRREREERRAGRDPVAALDVAAATVGRAVLVSGLTVMVALAGLLFTGLAVFSSMALATMLVALVAVVGSLTVLPATLALLGDRIDRGRIPGLGRSRGSGAWARLAGAVTRRPRTALVAALCLLAALSVPVLGLRTADPDGSDLPRDLPVMAAQRAIEHAFPGAPDDAQLVVTGARLGGERTRLAALGRRARAVTGGRGPVHVALAADRRTAVVSVPMPDRGSERAGATVERLRAMAPPGVLVTGAAARNADFTARLSSGTPVVIAFVLGLAFLLLGAAFRSPALAAAVVGLNLLSVGAAYGLLVATFQHSWAEGLLGFTSNGTIVNWLPLFVFVILFGLSMDYTVLVLERIREARRSGRPARRAAAEGVAATAGTVTSAAVVMVAVFAVFATLRLLEMKQFGVGLAAAVVLDATIVRGVALPAAVTLLGERRWRVPRRREAVAPRLAAEAGR